MVFDQSVRPASLYIHWPFCPYKCHFCPFVALAGHDQFMERYHEALTKEVVSFARNYEPPLIIDTLFLGGGTPSTWPAHLLLDMFGTLNNVFAFSENPEITIEVNPGTVDLHKLKTWKKVGINRLSIGVQSLNDQVLKKLNRHQSVNDVQQLLDKAGYYFDALSIDLILGLPGVSKEEWQTIVSTVASWPVDHISVYFLTVHENTPLYFAVRKNTVQLPFSDELLTDLYIWTVQELASYGFEQYELSNFARMGKRSRHNKAYWERKAYKGFGLGACSFDKSARFQNTKNLLNYLDTAGHEDKCTNFYEKLTEEQHWIEKVMLQLRQTEGIAMNVLLEQIAPEKRNFAQEVIEQLCNQRLLQYASNSISLTVAGFAVEHEIITRLVALR